MLVGGVVLARASGCMTKPSTAQSGDGEVYRWDLRTLRPFARHQDEGSVGCSAIAMSPDSSLYAVGYVVTFHVCVGGELRSAD